MLKYIYRYPHYHLFETPNLLWFNEQLFAYNQKICYMAEYFLPDINVLKALPCDYEMSFLEKGDFEEYYNFHWANALCAHRPNRDELALGAYNKDGELIGLAGCSSDCDDMWQIGVDVLSEYRRQGVASALTSNLALEILRRGKVPFYCCAWSNIPSAKNAVKSGFRPAWVEMTVKPADFVDNANKVNDSD